MFRAYNGQCNLRLNVMKTASYIGLPVEPCGASSYFIVLKLRIK
jgi:hypothetical protein